MKGLKEKYDVGEGYVDISMKLAHDPEEFTEQLFQFEASLYIPKSMIDDADCDDVLGINVIGHTGNFDSDYIYAADAISESTIENYSFLRGLYEELFNSEFHNKIIVNTGKVINRWVTLEMVFIGKEFNDKSEGVQADLFKYFLITFKKTWSELFYDDINLLGFSEGLYISEDEVVQKELIEMYSQLGFFPTINKQKFIDNNYYSEAIMFKELLELDSNNKLFGTEIKNPKRLHFSGVFYNL